MAAMWSASKACRMPERVRRDAEADAEDLVDADLVVLRRDDGDQHAPADDVQAATNRPMPPTETHSRRVSAAPARATHAGRVEVSVLTGVLPGGSGPTERGPTFRNVRRGRLLLQLVRDKGRSGPSAPAFHRTEACPVDVDDLAVDEARGVGRQPDQGADQVLHPAPTAGGGAAADPGGELLVGHQGAGELGLEVAGPMALTQMP